MPDRADVEQSLAGLLAGVLYPGGPGTESAIGNICKIYRGWPVAGALEPDLAQGVLHVTVQPVAGTVRDKTRFSQEWQGTTPAPAMTGLVNGELVTFIGNGGPNHVAGVKVDGRAYAYRMRTGDSAALVAAALASQIRAVRPALASNATIQLLHGRAVAARVVTDGAGGQELRRQQAVFRITCWCPDPAMRDVAVALLDTALAGRIFVDVNGWACRLQYSGDSSTDEGSAAGIWRRDLLYTIEYPTVLNESLPAMLFGITDVNQVPFVG